MSEPSRWTPSHRPLDTERTHDAASSRLLQAVFEQASDAILLADDQGCYIDANPAACRLIGYDREELVGMHVSDLTPDEVRDRVPEAWQSFRQSGREEGEFTLQRKDGARIEAEYRAVADIMPGVHLSILTDITERRRSEQELLQARKMEGIGRLAGGVAHDFNNLITAISGYSDLCLAAVPEGVELREYLGEIKRAGNRGAALARQLLAFSRMQVLTPVALDLNEVVADAETALRRLLGDEILLTTELAADLPRIRADADQIRQVFENLVVNARDAMPRGGELVIETARAELTAANGKDYAFALRPGTYARVSLRDTGHGMSAEVRDRVFEPFFTTKGPGQGTGLGLSTAYGIVKQSGGYIVVDSEPGHGTRCEILLPEAETPACDPARRPAERPVSPGRETILVVEDERPLRRLLGQILVRAGYTVVEAGGGREALETCRDLSEAIDLVITDVVMPDMSGPTLAKELAGTFPATQVLLISGYPGDTIVRQGDLTQERPFLQKPFDQETLLRTVRDLLDGKP